MLNILASCTLEWVYPYICSMTMYMMYNALVSAFCVILASQLLPSDQYNRLLWNHHCTLGTNDSIVSA